MLPILDLSNPKTDPKKYFEEYLRILVSGQQICHRNLLNRKLEIIQKPQIRSYQLENQIMSKERTEITEVLIYIWRKAGWIEEANRYKSIYGWEFDFSPKGLRILKRIIKEENNREVADK